MPFSRFARNPDFEESDKSDSIRGHPESERNENGFATSNTEATSIAIATTPNATAGLIRTKSDLLSRICAKSTAEPTANASEIPDTNQRRT